MKIRDGIVKKGWCLAIMLLFVGVSVISGMNGDNEDTNMNKKYTSTSLNDARILRQNQPPVANDDYVTIQEDQFPNQIDVLANDYDPDGDSLSITDVTQPSHGIAVYTADYVYYTPDSGYSGPDQFNYTIDDGNGSNASATVYITVVPVNDPPTANDDYATVAEDSSNNQIDVLANDTDPDGDDLEITNVTQPVHGTALYTADYVYYTPDPEYSGPDIFEYAISDGEFTVTANVYVTVIPVNDPPTANFTFTPINPINTNIVEFIDNSTDSDGTIVNWWWNFGDGYYSDLQNPIHCYYVSGTYTVSLTVTDDDGDTNTSSVQIIVITPIEAIENLIDNILDMDLSRDIENILISKLNNTINFLNNNQTDAAINQLEEFINKVEAQRGKKLTDEQADYLHAAAQAIIDSL